LENKEKSRLFLTIFNEIEDYSRRLSGRDDYVSFGSIVRELAEIRGEFNRYKEDLRDFARLRNAIVHNPDKRNADPIAEPHEYIIEKFARIKNELINPSKAIDKLAVRMEKIFTASMNDSASEIMSKMGENGYSYVPIINDGYIIGMFCEHTVFSYIDKHKKINLGDMKIEAFSEFISLDKHVNEAFVFIHRDTLVYEVEDLFKAALRKNRRIASVFITQNGKASERLLGLITAWDVAGYNDEQ